MRESEVRICHLKCLACEGKQNKVTPEGGLLTIKVRLYLKMEEVECPYVPLKKKTNQPGEMQKMEMQEIRHKVVSHGGEEGGEPGRRGRSRC